MYLNFSNFRGRTSAGGGQALVQKRGQVLDGGELAKFSPDGGTPPRKKTLIGGVIPHNSRVMTCHVLFHAFRAHNWQMKNHLKIDFC